MEMILALAAVLAAPSASDEHRLTPEQIEAVLADAARKRQADERLALPEAVAEGPSRPVHGEFGVSIGTGGYRELYGTTIVPLSDQGAAAISFDFIDLGKRRTKR